MIKLLPILLIFLFSCKTTRQIVKETIKYDSAAIKENIALHRFLSEEIERFEKERETRDSTEILFDTPCPDSTKSEPTKIVFNDSGKIKSIESSRIRSLSQSLHETSSELLDDRRTIDSLQYKSKKEQIIIKKETITIHKHTKTKVTGWPVWLFAICFIGGLLIEYKYKIVKRILSFKLKL